MIPFQPFPEDFFIQIFGLHFKFFETLDIYLLLMSFLCFSSILIAALNLYLFITLCYNLLETRKMGYKYLERLRKKTF